MKKTVCEWKTSDGKHTLKIGTTTTTDQVWVWAEVDGGIERECLGPNRQERTIGGVRFPATIGRVVLTTERLSALDAAVENENAILRGTPQGLRRERESLADLCRADYSDAERAWEHEKESECFRLRAAEDARVAKSMEILRQFDAQHPEVLDEIKKDRAEMVKKHVWD